MISGAPDALLSGFVKYFPRVASWRSGDLLADTVPVHSGRLTWSAASQVAGQLTIRVRRFSQGVDWCPGLDPYHPLARFGQQLDVTIVVQSSLDGVEYEHRRGRYVIVDWKDAGEYVDVVASDVLYLAAEAKLRTALAPRTGGTLASEFRRLLPAGLSASFDGALVDRACPKTMTWTEDRIGALYEIAAAWPARILADGYGQVLVLPPLPAVPVPVVTFRDGEGGTLVGSEVADSRAGAYNVVVARSSATDSPQQSPVQAEAEVQAGPMAPAEYGEVVEFYSTPLASTAAQLAAVAQTRLANSRRAARIVPVEAYADPRLELGDPARAQKGWDGYRFDMVETGFIASIDLPLTPADGNMRADLAVG